MGGLEVGGGEGSFVVGRLVDRRECGAGGSHARDGEIVAGYWVFAGCGYYGDCILGGGGLARGGGGAGCSARECKAVGDWRVK